MEGAGSTRNCCDRTGGAEKLAYVFACAGLVAELLYVYNEGPRNVLSNAFSVWMLACPIVFGIHLLYRLHNVPASVVTDVS